MFNFIEFLFRNFNLFLLLADESCAFEIHLDAELRRGSPGVRSDEACICGSVGHQPDHSRRQAALLEPKIARSSCVSTARYKVLIMHYITIAFVYCNCYRGPNGDVSVHVEWIDNFVEIETLRVQSFKYYLNSIYLIKKVYIFLARPFHAFSFAGSPFSRLYSGPL